jgi:hypothetical protein
MAFESPSWRRLVAASPHFTCAGYRAFVANLSVVRDPAISAALTLRAQQVVGFAEVKRSERRVVVDVSTDNTVAGYEIGRFMLGTGAATYDYSTAGTAGAIGEDFVAELASYPHPCEIMDALSRPLRRHLVRSARDGTGGPESVLAGIFGAERGTGIAVTEALDGITLALVEFDRSGWAEQPGAGPRVIAPAQEPVTCSVPIGSPGSNGSDGPARTVEGTPPGRTRRLVGSLTSAG